MIFRSTRWKRYRSWIREHLAAIVATFIALLALGFVSFTITYKFLYTPAPNLTIEKLDNTPTAIEKYIEEPEVLYE